MASVHIIYFLHIIMIISLCISISCEILSPLLHDIYYQQHYLHLKSQREPVVLNNAVSILMMEYTYLFEGTEAASQGGSKMVGTNLIEFLYIKTSVLLLLLLFLELVC